MAESNSEIGLADLLIQLRSELDAAQQNLTDAKKGAVLFVDSAEVEVHFEVEKSKEGGGGVRFHVISVGGKLGRDEHTTQRLLLTLKPDPGSQIAAAGEGTGAMASRPPERPR